MSKLKKITVLGGGTGTFVVLTGLKKYPIDLGVIVSMMDSGGSTGKLRDQLGVLPPGDLRQCLVALSEAPLLWRQLFLYRFSTGDMAGHNFGNIFLSALEKVCQDYNQVVDTASFVLKTKGKVIPVTFDKTHLCVKYQDGKVIKGEGKIDENNDETSTIIKAYLEPAVKSNIKAIKRITESDFLVIGPGDLYTSIIPILLVGGIKKTIQTSRAKIIYVLNLMTKFGQTTNYQASHHLKDLEKYLGRSIDYVLVNNGQIAADILKWYLSHKEKPVINDLKQNDLKTKIIEGNLISNQRIVKNPVDRLTRSILRHDPKKLAQILWQIINKKI
ncbi:MAG: YvcK family protein [Microgenomates group bacterium]|nr:YvcK family protein [Microgenomates group bacterium]